MEKKLAQLFGFQRFEANKDLQQVIESVHAKYATRELSFDDMEMVNAAGTPDLPVKGKDGENK